MEQVVCKYHPKNSPHWFCEHCNIHFCGTCVPGARTNYYKNKPRCILCNNHIDYQGGAHGTEPFWNLAGRFFLYPLNKPGLIAIATITVACYLAMIMHWTISIAIGLAILAGLTKYTMLIIESSSQGKNTPPGASAFLEPDLDRLFLKLVAIFFLFGFVISLVQFFISPFVAYLIQQVINFCLPAIIMLLAISKSVGTCLNPLNYFSFIVKIGLPYLLLYICLSFVSNGPQFVLPVILGLLPQWLAVTSIVVVSVYFLFVTARMMGYTVYQYQGVLGFSSNDDEKYYLEPDIFETQVVIGKVHVLIQEGRYEEAQKSLREAISKSRENLELHEYFHKLMMATNNTKTLVAHTIEITKILIKKGYPAKAAGYYLNTLSKGEKLIFEDSDTCYQIANSLYQQGKYKAALQLLVGMHKRDPTHSGIFDAYFLAAKLFIEGLSDDAKGGQLLNYIQKTYPEHSRFDEVSTYRKSILSS